MNRNVTFLVAANLLIGSFLGSYYAKRAPTPSYKLVEADKIIASGTGDTHALARATDLINEVIAQEPDNPKALMIKALSLQRRGLTDEAIETYEKLNSSAESLARYGHFNVGVLYQIKNQPDKAELNYRLAIDNASGVPLFWSNLIKLLVQSNKIEEAKIVLDDALVTFPNAPEFNEFSELRKR